MTDLGMRLAYQRGLPSQDKQPHYWLRLGTRALKQRGVAGSVVWLNRAKRWRLPVPDGVVVLDSAWHVLVSQGLIRISLDDHTLHIPNPDALLMALRLTAFSKDDTVDIRPAFRIQDTQGIWLRDVFARRGGVAARNPFGMGQALGEVWGSSLQILQDFRRDVLIMKSVDAIARGTAFSLANGRYNIIQPANEAPQFVRWGRRSAARRTRQINRMLWQLRQLIGRTHNFMIDWADDGQKVWLLGVHPEHGLRDDLPDLAINERRGVRLLQWLPAKGHTEPMIPAEGQHLLLAFTKVVVFHDDKVVLIYEMGRDQWEAPGGGIDGDETPLEGAHRELWEEAAQKTGSLHFAGLMLARLPTGRGFWGAVYTGELSQLRPFIANNETSALALWSPDAAFDGFISPIDLAIIERVRSLRG